MKINLQDVKLTPILESVRREKMSDERYFSSEFADYISNSRLKLINKDQDGSLEKYNIGLVNTKTSSLNIGSAVHQLILESETFQLGPDLDKPGSKLGWVIDEIKTLRNSGLSINDSIVSACKKIQYYDKNLSVSRIKNVIKNGFPYYWKSNKFDNSTILLSTRDRKTVETCISNLKQNKKVVNLLSPTDLFGDPILSFNEEAFFIDIKAEYDKYSCILPLKMKADNWSIDTYNKIITLNDLKTTGYQLSHFMCDGGSFDTFHYYRQFAYYLYILLKYCAKEYNYDEDEWTVRSNVIVVETSYDNNVDVFTINNQLINKGYNEFYKLLKLVACGQMFGFDLDEKDIED